MRFISIAVAAALVTTSALAAPVGLSPSANAKRAKCTGVALRDIDNNVYARCAYDDLQARADFVIPGPSKHGVFPVAHRLPSDQRLNPFDQTPPEEEEPLGPLINQFPAPPPRQAPPVNRQPQGPANLGPPTNPPLQATRPPTNPLPANRPPANGAPLANRPPADNLPATNPPANNNAPPRPPNS
ncbi:hypothetical protein EIP91_011799 [Steccherinum ochraceum]|uniref:Uncharacterized protein n=1 Tax=Steccherinum ochraceum TaxID=92696 RepID=A0A4R0RP92_9APHY|nr:hypothetical protein EIP91_011799 [Steccherinum ochraceum]